MVEVDVVYSQPLSGPNYNYWQERALASSSRRSSSAGPSRPSGPPSTRGPSPIPRLAPLVRAEKLSSISEARDVWDPHTRDAQVERAVRIRACTDMSGILNYAPLTYRGVLLTIGSDLNSALDTLDALQSRSKSWDKISGRGELPFHYNSLKKVPRVQFPKEAQAHYKEHFMLPAAAALEDAAKALFQMERTALEKSIVELQNQVTLKALLPKAWKAIQDKSLGARGPGNR